MQYILEANLKCIAIPQYSATKREKVINRFTTVSEKKSEHVITANESISLSPGRYYVALKFVDEKKQTTKDGKILFPLYLKSSYIRNGATDTPEKNVR